MAIDPLKQDLIADLASAKSRSEQFQKGAGAPPADPISPKLGFEARGARIKEKLFLAKELQDIDLAFKNTTGEFLRTTQFSNNAERALTVAKFDKLAKNFKTMMIEKGLNMELQVKKSQLDSDTEVTIANMLSNAGQGLGTAVAYNMFQRPGRVQTRRQTTTTGSTRLSPDVVNAPMSVQMMAIEFLGGDPELDSLELDEGRVVLSDPNIEGF